MKKSLLGFAAAAVVVGLAPIAIAETNEDDSSDDSCNSGKRELFVYVYNAENKKNGGWDDYQSFRSDFALSEDGTYTIRDFLKTGSPLSFTLSAYDHANSWYPITIANTRDMGGVWTGYEYLLDKDGNPMTLTLVDQKGNKTEIVDCFTFPGDSGLESDENGNYAYIVVNGWDKETNEEIDYIYIEVDWNGEFVTGQRERIMISTRT